MSELYYIVFEEEGTEGIPVKRLLRQAAKRANRAKATKVTVNPDLPTGVARVKSHGGGDYYCERTGHSIPKARMPPRNYYYRAVSCHVEIAPIIFTNHKKNRAFKPLKQKQTT